MSRFLFLEHGQELTAATERALGDARGPIALRLLEDAPPFRATQIFHVRALGPGEAPRGLVLRREAGDYALRNAGAAGGGATGDTAAVGRVVLLEHGAAVLALDRPPLCWLPVGWLPGAVRALEVLARFRQPLTPPLFLGPADASLVGVRDKYGQTREVRRYVEHVGDGLDARERDLVARHVRAGGRLLDIGCGAGRTALAFARLGYRVTAIDVAPAMIAAARELAAAAGLDLEFRVQSATELEDPPGAFDGVFFICAYHHIPGRTRRVGTLERLRRALAPDGVLILTVFYRSRRRWLSRSRLVDACRRAGARILGPDRVSEPGDGWMRDVSDGSDPRTPVFFHDFDGPDDVRAELEAAGFAAEEAAPGWWLCRTSARVA